VLVERLVADLRHAGERRAHYLFCGLNLLEGLTFPVLGCVVTCVIVGGGSELLDRIIEAAGDLAQEWAAPTR
jgi:hypothetical protein